MRVEAPDYLGPAVGFREWHVTPDHFLYSPITNHIWHPHETMVAHCLIHDSAMKALGHRSLTPGEKYAASGEHKIPDIECNLGMGYGTNQMGCGLYMFKNYDIAVAKGDGLPCIGIGLRGIVECGGDIAEHRYGFRAHHGRVVAIINDMRASSLYRYYVDMVSPGGHAFMDDEVVESVITKYDVPLLHPTEINEFIAKNDYLVLDTDERRINFCA